MTRKARIAALEISLKQTLAMIVRMLEVGK